MNKKTIKLQFYTHFTVQERFSFLSEKYINKSKNYKPKTRLESKIQLLIKQN